MASERPAGDHCPLSAGGRPRRSHTASRAHQAPSPVAPCDPAAREARPSSWRSTLCQKRPFGTASAGCGHRGRRWGPRGTQLGGSQVRHELEFLLPFPVLAWEGGGGERKARGLGFHAGAARLAAARPLPGFLGWGCSCQTGCVLSGRRARRVRVCVCERVRVCFKYKKSSSGRVATLSCGRLAGLGPCQFPPRWHHGGKEEGEVRGRLWRGRWTLAMASRGLGASRVPVGARGQAHRQNSPPIAGSLSREGSSRLAKERWKTRPGAGGRGQQHR